MKPFNLKLKKESYQNQLLPPQERLPQEGVFPAIQTDDGAIYFDIDSSTHILLIKNQNIPPDRIVSGGWLVDGIYNPTECSDTMRFVERYKARKRADENRMRSKQNETF